MKRKAHGAQEPRHIKKYVEVASAAQRSDSLAQTINQHFRWYKTNYLNTINEQLLNDNHRQNSQLR